MVLKVFRLIWFVSVLVVFGSLLFSYATWQEQLIVQEENAGAGQVLMARDTVFYIFVAVIGLVNVLVYLVSRLYPKREDLRAWFHGLVTTINVFLVVAVALIGIYNGTEPYDFSRVGSMIYGSVILIAVWALGWPVYLLTQKIFVKQAV